MRRVPPPRLEVEALHARLCERIAELRPLVVADAMCVFLEVSSLPCEQALRSFEFAFDEDDGRVARVEARFAPHGAPDLARSRQGAPTYSWGSRRSAHGEQEQDLRGYAMHMLLPKIIPTRAPADGVRAAENVAAHGSLVARFTRALADLGAYRTIEMLEAGSAEVYLL